MIVILLVEVTQEVVVEDIQNALSYFAVSISRIENFKY